MSVMGEADAPVRFALLGPVRAWRGPEELPLGGTHPRLVLALLLARPGGLVEVPELVDLLWGSDVPASAVNMVHRYVGMLRRVLEPGLPARAGGRWLLRDIGGYRLAPDGSGYDLLEFRQAVDAARRLIAEGDEPAALDGLTTGLALWHGRCAAGLSVSVESHPDFVAIDREYFAAVRLAASVALRCGAPGRVLPALRAAVARDPLDEVLQAHLLLVLAADGNHGEALVRYGDVRARLADELGVDPGPELQAAYQSLLQQESGPGTPPGKEEPVLVRPAQLPSDLFVFTGRESFLDEGTALLSAAQPSVPILVFDGMPGVGKTTLAIRLAHRLGPRFPDGQLYADLRGFDAEDRVTDPADVLQTFLGALGVRPESIPDSLDGRAALYRSVTAGRRLLIVLDNARDVAQVQPLLPGTAPNAVLVTGRGRLGGLVTAHGAHLRSLDVLSDSEARACFLARVGPARYDAEPQAVEQIIERCGSLPLALAVVAARAAADPGQPLSAIAAELSPGGDRLSAFSDDGLDRDVRTVFTWSYRSLTPEAARVLRLLPRHPGADITAEVGASLTGTTLPVIRSHFAELIRTGLLNRYRPSRYRLHDLVRAFATELGTTRNSAADLAEAEVRLEEHYLHTTYGAVRLVRPGFADVDATLDRDDVTVEEFADVPAALAWFGDEHLTIRAVVARAAARGAVGTSWKLAMLAKDLYLMTFRWRDWATTAALAVEEATRAGDITGMAQSHRSLAGALHYLGEPAGSVHHLRTAAALFEQSDDRIGRAEVLMNLGFVAQVTGDQDAAIDMLRKSLAIFVAAGRLHQELNVLTILADSYFARGDGPRSWDTALAGVRLARSLGDVDKEERAMSTLSQARAARGQLVAALRSFEYYGKMQLRAGDLHNAAMNRIEIGLLLYAAGEVTDACEYWKAAHRLSDDSVLDQFVSWRLPPGTYEIYQQVITEMEEHPQARPGAGPA